MSQSLRIVSPTLRAIAATDALVGLYAKHCALHESKHAAQRTIARMEQKIKEDALILRLMMPEVKRVTA